MIKLENIHVTFAPGTITEKKALRGIDLRIDEKEFLTVIGSNGAGKSTLLNLIAGEVIASQGKLLVDQEDVTSWPAHQRVDMVARVFQDPLAGTCGELTIAENLALAARRGQRRCWVKAITKIDRDFFKTKLSRLKLGLENRLDTQMSLLSGGQRQAVSLIMATLSPMKIFLLDEHTSALDPKTAAFIMDLTQQIIEEEQLTALMITHSLHQALHLGSRTIMLHEGKIIYDVAGATREAVTVPDLLAKFGTAADDDKLLLN
jgi:putative tryptophan/tyrosine transport system ATP-binding protein